MCCPTPGLTEFGIGGTSSPYDDDDERVECVRWKKPEEAISDEMGDDDLVVVLGL